ncbi:hypothetical protein FSS13T_12640 [Flavobacterium saliperosum S13]|uniref:Uncharacterized protein n=2 Tax=Flavobacterium saliperosum TaxID=329186 RepID=A0A1G4VCU6_9FLAO|nr:hypothetical protein [Flavobacterium saliperosum]ESU25982.1 hypothetical protein FSS13T_12640 [Flavobacterium saliperosum S13]SCX04781.1 hypothetical protein SAMN02927925_00695 [Flavobacterium saliperosum]
MNIYPKNGIGELLFGMKQQHVITLIGKPNKQFTDEEKNVVYLYNQHKLRLTFYEEEEFRLGYMVISHPETTLFDKEVIGRMPKEVQNEAPERIYKSWEIAEEDGIVSYFNEDNWLMLICEFDEITKVEVGAIIENDEFDWRFSG